MNGCLSTESRLMNMTQTDETVKEILKIKKSNIKNDNHTIFQSHDVKIKEWQVLAHFVNVKRVA